jgi:hypothetical protein
MPQWFSSSQPALAVGNEPILQQASDRIRRLNSETVYKASKGWLAVKPELRLGMPGDRNFPLGGTGEIKKKMLI